MALNEQEKLEYKGMRELLEILYEQMHYKTGFYEYDKGREEALGFFHDLINDWLDYYESK